MNQFKQAKKRMQESGRITENVTDLKTAGVSSEATIDQDTDSPKDTLINKAEEKPLVETLQPKQPEPDTNISPQNSIDTINIEVPVDTEENKISQPIPSQPEIVQIPTVSAVQEQPMEVITPLELHEPEYTYETRPVSKGSGKKSVPNIFAPKGEAKSMRKSLVLKPTSVKIAENYCAKNGGSFNELIQTLLDNFIEEYGL